MPDNDDEQIRRAEDRAIRTKRARPTEEYDDDDDDPEPRRVRRRSSDDEGDVTGGVIPYKNPKALAAYYCGVFGLISCFLMLGIFGIVPIILGVLGLRHARTYPEAKGQFHAIVGIALGSLELLTFVGMVGAIFVGLMSKR